ncbi:MAG: tripeptide aminopeptidase PepT, partial [Ileibacterium sp.]|nr:tripeptide aminopeptidase PepT [Ileibacterium sp.]
MSVQDRFLRYVSIDTQSDPESPTAPSTMKQLDLARLLKEEMEEMGLSDVYLSDTGVVYGTLKADQPAGLEAIGLIAHMDTAKEMPGKDVKPRVIHAWDGNKIQLNEKWSMTKEAFPALNDVVGDDIIVTDGTTLLGADDKAGIAIILETVQQMAKESGRKRDIYVAFTPDEEIGRGVENFELDRFPVEFAYTLDGGEVHGVEYETFNAAGAKITIQGASVHPGSAKDKMVNAALIGAEYAMMMPG